MKILALVVPSLLLATAGVAAAAPGATPRVAHTVSASGWVGGVHLNSSLAQAIARFGRPDTEQSTALACTVTWSRIELRAGFGFGHKGHAPVGCAPNAIAESFSGGHSWSAGSLRVGMAASAITQRYPGATHRAGPAGETVWSLAPRSDIGPRLMATTSALGTVVAVGVASGAILGGFDVVWG